MTKLMTPLVRTARQLPALFNENWLGEALSAFDRWDKAFEQENAHYPYDVSYIKDKNGDPVEYRLEIALAGIDKENIKLNVKENHLVVEVSKQPKQDRDDLVWLRNNISYRAANLVFSLGKDVDKENIKSKYRDGLLSVYIPIVKPMITDIEISVE